MNHQALSSFIWSVADLLRGDYKQSEYGRVILPFTVLRRLDCVLEPTKSGVLAEFEVKTVLQEANCHASGFKFICNMRSITSHAGAIPDNRLSCLGRT